MGEPNVAEVTNLGKRYGELRAVDDISFEVHEGEIFGLIGPNGAGKTTALRVLATLLVPTSGSASVLGHDVVREPEKVRPVISYLAEEAGTYRNLTGYEYVSVVSRVYFRSTLDAEGAVEEAVRIAGLGDRMRDKMKTYSKGMKRRIQVARALMTRPRRS